VDAGGNDRAECYIVGQRRIKRVDYLHVSSDGLQHNRRLACLESSVSDNAIVEWSECADRERSYKRDKQ
jgi:hypothetical protein